MKRVLSVVFIILSIASNSQDISFDRLRAIDTNGSLIFYNIAGISITSELMFYSYKDFNLELAFDLYKVKSSKKTQNKNLKYENVHTVTELKINDDITQFNSYYFIKNKNNKVIIFHFGSINKVDENFEIDFIDIVLENKIPNSCFSERPLKKIDFASRIFEIECDCHYENVNSIQCPFNGQISWSIHKNLIGAKKQIEYEYEITKSKNIGKLIKVENINLVFEGINTVAKKAIFEANSTSIFGADSKSIDGKKLIIYYVAEKIRGINISCVLSHWEDDKNDFNNLPMLLNEIIKI